MAVEQFYGIGTAGNNGVECRVYVSITDDAANNRSSIDAELQVRKANGYTSQGNMSGSFNIDWDSDAPGPVGITISGNKTLPGNGTWVSLGAAGRQYFSHHAGGWLPGTVSVRVNSVAMSGSQDYDTAITGTLNFSNGAGFTDYIVPPYAPYNLAIRAGSITTNSFGVEYARNSYDAIDVDNVHWATDPNFANIVWNDTGAAGYSNPSGIVALTPGTTYYVRVYSHTSAGWGPASATISQITLPATPPGMTVSSSPSGTSATLKFTPPGGVTGVTRYNVEYQQTLPTLGGIIPTGVDNGTVLTVTGLTPGNTYQWRSSANIGGYTSPGTGWTVLTQAKPNVNPGDYFDGSTPDVADLNYQWGTDGSGTPDASISTALASGVAGWEVQSASGLAAVLYRVTAGIVGSTYAARVQVTRDATAAFGFRAGQKNADPYRTEVTTDGTYVGSIYVRPSRSQSLAAEITWLTEAGAAVGARLVGAATVVPGGTWLRLAVGGSAPAGATFAVIRAIDVSGTGWSVWQGGDTMDLDGAMISLSTEFPYFDGSTTDDGTYTYDWVDPASPHASTSKRTALAQAGTSTLSRSARAILDPSCIPPAPPRPPTIPSDCIVEAGIWRRYFAKIPAVDISDWLSVVPTFEIVTQSQVVSQVRIRVYPNPTDGPPEFVDATTWVSEQIVSFVPANTVLTIDGVHQRVWAEVSGGDSISADHLLYGSNGAPPTWAVLSCGISYALSVDLPVEIAQGDARIYTSLTTRY